MKDKNIEIIKLSEEILQNIELDEIPIRSIVLKCSRLARITDNQNAMSLFNYELVGYPKDEKGFIRPDAFSLSRYVNRTSINEKNIEVMFTETIAELEAALDAAKEQMKVSQDPNVSLSSSNQYQWMQPPMGNSIERGVLRLAISSTSRKINQLKAGYYNYVVGVYYEANYTKLAESIFERKKLLADKQLSQHIPQTLQKFISSYENLASKNEEDWANAAHTCRRIIKDVADYLYPPSKKTIVIGDQKKVELNDENYVIRLKEYIKSKSKSSTFNSIVGSNLDYIGNRLDALYKSSTKGSHANVSKEEAERYVIYTYLFLSDILSL